MTRGGTVRLGVLLAALGCGLPPLAPRATATYRIVGTAGATAAVDVRVVAGVTRTFARVDLPWTHRTQEQDDYWFIAAALPAGSVGCLEVRIEFGDDVRRAQVCAPVTTPATVERRR